MVACRMLAGEIGRKTGQRMYRLSLFLCAAMSVATLAWPGITVEAMKAFIGVGCGGDVKR